VQYEDERVPFSLLALDVGEAALVLGQHWLFCRHLWFTELDAMQDALGSADKDPVLSIDLVGL